MKRSGSAPAGDDLPTLQSARDRKHQATRLRILDATAECLVSHGWSVTTMSLVAEYSKVSRGALQHYFPTREVLITEALDHLWKVSSRELLDENREPPQGVGREEHVVRVLFDYYSGPMFKAALQVWAAAATDADLRDLVLPMERRFARSAHRLAVELLGADDRDARTHRLIEATLDLGRGLGIADALTDDSRRRADIARAWADELRTIKTLPGVGHDDGKENEPS